MAEIPAEKPPRNGMLKIAHKPDTLVVHALAEFLDFETNGKDRSAKDHMDEEGLSPHYLITPTGVIIELIEYDTLGYHAKGHNTNKVGVELLVPGLHTYGSFLKAIDKKGWVSGPQYQALLQLTKWLKTKGVKNQVAHSTLSPERKYDPGKGFDWDKYIKDLK